MGTTEKRQSRTVFIVILSVGAVIQLHIYFQIINYE